MPKQDSPTTSVPEPSKFQTIEEVLENLYNAAWLEGSKYPENAPIPSKYEVEKTHKAKAAIQAMVEDIIGKHIPTFGPQNEAGHISEDDYVAYGHNQAVDEAIERATKYNLTLQGKE
jgi:vacuolar-type H+-ATPase subunit D/Vma8